MYPAAAVENCLECVEKGGIVRAFGYCLRGGVVGSLGGSDGKKRRTVVWVADLEENRLIVRCGVF